MEEVEYRPLPDTSVIGRRTKYGKLWTLIHGGRVLAITGRLDTGYFARLLCREQESYGNSEEDIRDVKDALDSVLWAADIRYLDAT